MFSLKIVKGADLAEGVITEARLPAPLARFTIGRDPANEWLIPDRTLAISARHCEIVAAPGGAVLRDLSTNGTFINGATTRLQGEHPLKHGDRIELGPYTITVQALAASASVPAPHTDIVLPPQAPPPRTPSVEATAPMRGGDPAAMLAKAANAAKAAQATPAAPARPALTEILRQAPPPEDTNLALTRIRLAPKVAGAPAPRVTLTPLSATPALAPAPVAPVPPAAAVAPAAVVAAVAPVEPVAPAPPPAPAAAAPAPPEAAPSEAAPDPLLTALATGLGLPVQALAGREPAQAAAQVGALARAAVTVLRQLLEQQAQSRRQLGSRTPALLPMRDTHPLRRAASPEAALAALLAPGADAQAPLQRAATELAAHQDRLLAAFRTAAMRMGEDIEPAALQAALPDAPPAQLWQLYGQLWQGLGLAPGLPWSQAFLEAALLHLAAAYDDAGPR